MKQEAGGGGNEEQPSLDVRPILERMMARLLEDIECGRTKVTVGDLQRVIALAQEANRKPAREIEVRWIEKPKDSGEEE